jgi:hypothetical protein
MQQSESQKAVLVLWGVHDCIKVLAPLSATSQMLMQHLKCCDRECTVGSSRNDGGREGLARFEHAEQPGGAG